MATVPLTAAAAAGHGAAMIRRRRRKCRPAVAGLPLATWWRVGRAGCGFGNACRAAPVPVATKRDPGDDSRARDGGRQGSPAATATTAADGTIQIRFSADTWYEVRDRTGKIILGGTAHAGETAAGSGAGGPYKLVLGNVKGVESIDAHGAPVDFQSARPETMRRALTLPCRCSPR